MLWWKHDHYENIVPKVVNLVISCIDNFVITKDVIVYVLWSIQSFFSIQKFRNLGLRFGFIVKVKNSLLHLSSILTHVAPISFFLPL
jgi:hypothetical protein